MSVFRSTTFINYVSVCCLLLSLSGVEGVSLRNKHHRMRAPVPTPAAGAPVPEPGPAFKQEKTQVTSEASLKAAQSQTQQELDRQIQMLNLEQQESAALMTLKATVEARETAERTLVHQRLVTSQKEVARLVSDLTHRSQNKMLIDLAILNREVAHAFLHHSSDAKFQQTPSSTTGGSGTSTPSTAKQAQQTRIIAKAADVVDAQLDTIIQSDELKYMKKFEDSASSDSSSTDVTEQDTGARPGESADQHYTRLLHEADALMAQAYPSIKCEGDMSATGGGKGSTGGTGGTGSTGTGGSGATGTGQSSTGGTGQTGGSSTGGATGESGGTAVSGAGTGGTGAGTGASGATGTGTGATGVSGATALGSSSS